MIIRPPDNLLKAKEGFAAATHHGVNEIVEQALRDWLARHQARSPDYLRPERTTTWRGFGRFRGLVDDYEHADDPA